MESSQRVATRGRGRPRRITRERIADVGIEIGLPNITFTGVAAALGVSHMALYKHVPSLAALKHLVAEEAFGRWNIPPVCTQPSGGLQDYLMTFTASVLTFVKAHPGLTPYVLRRMAATESMLAKIDAHHDKVAATFSISKDDARWLNATVTFQCIAAADTVYTAAGLEPFLTADRAAEEAEMEVELMEGVRALIIGALAILKDRQRR